MKSTNYYNTFISVAESCKRTQGTIPPEKSPQTVARMEYEMIHANPYKFTSDDVLFKIHNERNGATLLQDFFRKGQACFRCSPLPKSYGWGFHFDEEGRVAIIGKETPEYQKFLSDSDIEQKFAYAPKR